MKIRLIFFALALLLLAACSAAATPELSAPTAATSGSEPAGGETYNGMPVGFTPEGYPYRGSPDAPLTLYEFSDFQCPFCARHFVQTEPALNESYIQPGKVRAVWRDLPLAGLHPNAPAAHEASACVADQGAALFWAMHDALFQAQDEWAESSNPAPVLERLAGETGADVEAYRACMDAGGKQQQVSDSVEAAMALGYDGTPSFRLVDNATGADYSLIGAQRFDRFAQSLDAMLAGEAPPSASQPQPRAGLPFWATAEGLALDPSRPGYTVAGDQTRGSPDAKVVVVEYSDFQCPYCKRHAEQTQPELDAQFVDSGQVRWVFKHFPLGNHPQAPAAGVAAECAADQGQFWEMHQALFANAASWSVSDPSPVFIELAGTLGLDTGAFADCLEQPAKAEQVTADQADGASIVQGTPTFIILANGQGRVIPGALPLQSFVAEIERTLETAGS